MGFAAPFDPRQRRSSRLIHSNDERALAPGFLASKRASTDHGSIARLALARNRNPGRARPYPDGAMNTTVVVIDDRERAEPVAAALRRSGSVLIEVRRLPAGDYLVDDTLLFERKTLADLCASIKDGRLFAQGLRLTRAPQRPALILEGRSDALTCASVLPTQATSGAV